MTTTWGLVLDIARREPDRLAVDGRLRLSYAQLAERVEAVGTALGQEAGDGDVVAVRTSSPAAGLVAMLAAHAVGAAFVPLDTAAPPARQHAILADSGARAVLEASGDDMTIDVRAVRPQRPSQPLIDPGYLIYTSGSTGEPKGVMVSQRALLERLHGLARCPGFDPDASVLALTSLSFDISLAELLLPVVIGGRVVIPVPGARHDARILQEGIDAWRPSIVQGTPAFWRLMLASGWAGAPELTIWCGGEPMTATLATALLRRCARLWNLYGPTEATIWATAWPVQPGRPISLGDPLPGTTVELSDGDSAPDVGEPGEVVLSGAGIADGYLHGGEQDVARFGRDGTGRAVSYRTGDRARRHLDGSLEFLGRADAQVKLRGHRIELGEIEALLEDHPDVVEAAAFAVELDRTDGGYLTVAVVTDSGSVNTTDLRRWLLDRLPTAVVPKQIRMVDRLPRASSGKVDRVRLRDELGARR